MKIDFTKPKVKIITAAIVVIFLLFIAVFINPGPPSNLMDSPNESNYQMAQSDSAVISADGGASFNGAVVTSSYTSEAAGIEDKAYETPVPNTTDTKGKSTISSEQKLIKTGNIQIEVKDVHKAYQKIVDLSKMSGGYVYDMTETALDDGNTRIEMTVKVKVENFDQAGNALKSLGNVEYAQFNTEDITTEYIDTAARIKTLKIQEQTLLNIMSKATRISDLIELETELQRIREQIESNEGQIKYWDKSVEYSEIHISIYTQKPPTKAIEDKSILEVLTFSVKDGLGFWGKAVLNIVVALIWLAPAIIVLSIVFILGKFIYKKKKINRVSKEQEVLIENDPNQNKDSK